MPASLHQHWQRTVRVAPGAAALFDAATGCTWTRAALDALGAAWREHHGGPLAGQVVVFAEPNGPEWWRIFLGLLASDAIVTALDPSEPLAAQRSVAGKIRANFLWHAGQLEPVAGARKNPRETGTTRLIKLTSGSTGMPRALRFSDAQMLADGRQVCASMNVRATDVNLGCVPFGHSYGLGNLVLPLLTQGTAIVSGAPALPQPLATAIGQWRPTIFPAVPTLLRALAEADIAPAQLKSLRTVISAGAPLAPDIARAFHRKFGLKIHSFYGSSETGGITYDRTGDAALTGRSVGRPLDGVRLRFTTRQRFWVKSAAVMGRGQFCPADRGQLTPGGELVLLGRAGRMVKIGGRRLDPAEIERALRELPGVDDAFVGAHAVRADALAAVVASRQPAPELRELLQGRIAAWKIPKKILVVAQFPLTDRGKPDMRQLRALVNA